MLDISKRFKMLICNFIAAQLQILSVFMRISVVQNVKSDFWFQIELEEGNSKL